MILVEASIHLFRYPALSNSLKYDMPCWYWALLVLGLAGAVLRGRAICFRPVLLLIKTRGHQCCAYNFEKAMGAIQSSACSM